MNKTIAALATPPGIGGIAVIRLSGSEAFAIADKCFHGKILLANAASHTLYYGKILHEGNIVDTVVASVFREPNSYTGENVVEISCHGGMLVANEILTILYSCGAEPATPGEFTKRAFLNGKMDLAQVEAVADIIHSVSVPGCLTAARQLDGQFTERLKTLRRKLIDIASLLEIELDFSEEDIQFADRSQILKTMKEANNYCKELCDSYRASEILRSGYFVAIAGYPNSGKSTLFNSLLNRKRAIVSEMPGTTRDYLEETLFLNGIAVKLVDTAGFRNSKELIEIEGIKFAESILKQANLIFVINDVFVSVVNSKKLYDTIKSKYKSASVVLLQNKYDLIKDSYIQHDVKRNTIYISAKFDYGIEGLKEFILEEAKKSTARINDILINQRHAHLLDLTSKYLGFAIDAIKTCRETELVAIDIRSAASKLGEITGEKWSEEVLNNIFKRFCIGK